MCQYTNQKPPLTRLCRRCVSSVLCTSLCVRVLQQVSPSAACSRLSRRVWLSKTDQTWHTDWPHCSFLERSKQYILTGEPQHFENHLRKREDAYFLVLWVNLSVSLSRARAYSASMSPRRRRNSERSESCCCFTSTWESKILIWSVSWARRSDTHRVTETDREEMEDSHFSKYVLISPDTQWRRDTHGWCSGQRSFVFSFFAKGELGMFTFLIYQLLLLSINTVKVFAACRIKVFTQQVLYILTPSHLSFKSRSYSHSQM